MAKGIKYGILIILMIAVIGGGVFLYLNKDGYLVTFNSNGGSRVDAITTGLLSSGNGFQSDRILPNSYEP